MKAEVLRVSLKARRRGYIGWIVGIVLLTAFTFAFYPSLRDNPEFSKAIEDLPESLRSFVGEKDITSPEGYLESQLFLYVIPVLLFVFAIGQSADAIAGPSVARRWTYCSRNPCRVLESSSRSTSPSRSVYSDWARSWRFRLSSVHQP